MKKHGLISRRVLGVLIIALSGNFAAQSEENQSASAAAQTDLPPDSATSAVRVTRDIVWVC